MKFINKEHQPFLSNQLYNKNIERNEINSKRTYRLRAYKLKK